METPPPSPGIQLSPLIYTPRSLYSRKVFIGGLPPDIDEDEIALSFQAFGPLVVDWPYKDQMLSQFPPKGFAFVIFQNEFSVQRLIDTCLRNGNKYYKFISSSITKNKLIEIRPWQLKDSDFVADATIPVNPRLTVFVGGVPRTLKATELALIMEFHFGGVSYVGIETDRQFKYPKGAGRVTFRDRHSFIKAILSRFVEVPVGGSTKRAEVKHYLLDNQVCDECHGLYSEGPYAEIYCTSIICLQYYCLQCWITVHSRPHMEDHIPIPRRED